MVKTKTPIPKPYPDYRLHHFRPNGKTMRRRAAHAIHKLGARKLRPVSHRQQSLWKRGSAPPRWVIWCSIGTSLQTTLLHRR